MTIATCRWLPSLASYYGREDELPADGHMILALVAPRYAMLATARSDSEGDVTFADEQNVLACASVWKLLGAADAVHIKFREGRHHGVRLPRNRCGAVTHARSCPSLICGRRK